MRTATASCPEPWSTKTRRIAKFSNKRIRWGPATVTGIFLLAIFPGLQARASTPAASTGTAEAATRIMRPAWTAYAQVRPLGRSRVSALLDGTLSDFRVYPGMKLSRGEVVARLTGTERRKEVAEAEARLAEARSSLTLALQAQQAARRTYPAISDRLTLKRAAGAVKTARAALTAALARWRFVRDNGAIRAPVPGIVTVVHAANGDAVQAGQILLDLINPGSQWIYGIYYGPVVHRLVRGLRGHFESLDGGRPVPVQVAGIVPAVRPDGGVGVDCRILGGAPVREGEPGTLTLRGPAEKVTVVPTSALVLQGGRWYVLVSTGDGDRRQRVVPGRETAQWTVVCKGVRSGQRVVTKNAYQIFHKNVARSYTPPD